MRRLALALVVVSMISGVVLAGTITPELAAKLNSTAPAELIQISVTMKQQGDSELMRAMTVGMDRKATRETVVNYLQDLAGNTQAEALAYLNSLKSSGKVDRVMPLFIVNMIALRATPEVALRLAQFPGVDYVAYDPDGFMLEGEPVGPTTPQIDETDEITWGVTAVHAPEVWNLGYNGTGVLVGMLDTGVNYNHFDLADHMWNGGTQYPHHGYDFYNNDNDPIDDGPLGHGSHTAGTVASDGTAGTQAGVAPNATIMAIKVWSGSGYGNTPAMIAGINFAVAQGCDLYSMSGGWAGGGTTSDKQQFRTATDNSLSAGIAFTVAAGNEGSYGGSYAVPNNVRVPGNCPPPWLNPAQTLTGGLSAVICCGATQNTNPPTLAYFSSHGPCTWQGVTPWNDYAYNPGMGLLRPDVTAPGVGVKSCSWNNNSGYVLMDGTSMATPHVAGVVALMLSKNLTLTPRQQDSILEVTSLDLGATGKDNYFGAGFVNALNAVNGTPSMVPPNLNVTLTPNNPPIVIPANGGSFTFDASVVNAGPAQPFQVWARIKNPDGSYTAPTLGPVTVNPPVNQTITRNRTQNVPGTWAPGTYTYLGYANTTFSYPALDSSSFTFSKSTTANGGPMVWDSNCYGEPFPGETVVSAPASFGVAKVSPNPFNPTATISFTLPSTQHVLLNVYDMQGRLVANLVNGVRQAGAQQVTFDGSNLASGVYLYTLNAGQYSATGKMMLLK